MQIAITSAPVPGPPIPSYFGMKLGVLHPSNGQTWQLNAGKAIGLQTGYVSVVEAERGVQMLTAGAAPSAAILDAGGRYFAVEMKFNYDNSRFNLDYNRHRSISELNQNIRAIVEGGTIVNTPPTGGRVTFPNPAA